MSDRMGQPVARDGLCKLLDSAEDEMRSLTRERDEAIDLLFAVMFYPDRRDAWSGLPIDAVAAVGAEQAAALRFLARVGRVTLTLDDGTHVDARIVR